MYYQGHGVIHDTSSSIVCNESISEARCFRLEDHLVEIARLQDVYLCAVFDFHPRSISQELPEPVFEFDKQNVER